MVLGHLLHYPLFLSVVGGREKDVMKDEGYMEWAG